MIPNGIYPDLFEFLHSCSHIVIYSWLSLSRTRLTRISGWVEFLSKSRTSLCINIYNFTPVESNSDESKFRLSQIKVLVPRCRKPYYLHSLSRITCQNMCITLGLKSDHRWNIQSLTLTFLPQAISHVYFTICQIN